MKSILADDNEHCYLCKIKGRLTPKECEHHIYFGPLRKTSERMGFKVPLCNKCHNMSDDSVHFNRKLDLMLKKQCQAVFELEHSREEFMSLIGRNYLGEWRK